MALVIAVPLSYLLWSPGKEVSDGRHDRGQNGIWLQHGWLGDDGWFVRNDRTSRLKEFRDANRIRAFADKLRDHGFTDVYPHLCPCDIDGDIAKVDPAQLERFLDAFDGIRVIPWIGGVHGYHARPKDEGWRQAFVASAVGLIESHPRLAGVHVNIEPMPSGNQEYLALLSELKAALPVGTILSVAAYPPPTRWHPFPDVHWEEAYFRAVSDRADQLAPMMYDTSLRYSKLYQNLMAEWTTECLSWSQGKPVLLGLPAYEDAGVEYHVPEVENLDNALLGIHAGLGRNAELPATYQGIAVYNDWEMDESDWATLRASFLKAR